MKKTFLVNNLTIAKKEVVVWFIMRLLLIEIISVEDFLYFTRLIINYLLANFQKFWESG